MNPREEAAMKAELEAASQDLQAVKDAATAVYTPKVQAARATYEAAIEPHKRVFEAARGAAADEFNATVHPADAACEARRVEIRRKYTGKVT